MAKHRDSQQRKGNAGKKFLLSSADCPDASAPMLTLTEITIAIPHPECYNKAIRKLYKSLKGTFLHELSV